MNYYYLFFVGWIPSGIIATILVVFWKGKLTLADLVLLPFIVLGGYVSLALSSLIPLFKFVEKIENKVIWSRKK